MLVFIALILFVTIRKKLKSDTTVDTALLRLHTLNAKIYDTEIIIQKPNKKTKQIFKDIKIIVPTSLGI